MRRFVSSLPGRVVSHIVCFAVALPSLTLVLIGKAEAQQIQDLPSWAVIDFANLSGKGGPEIGVQAADALSNELSKTGRYDVLPREQVRRAMEAAGLQHPFKDQTALIRLAQDLNVSEIVTGDVIDWRVRPVENGKRGDVALRIVVRNAASSLTINGAALAESSPTRSADLADNLLVEEAFGVAATRAVSEMNALQLPRATLLNTFTDEAVLNQGSRSGFKIGQHLVILRGREQVATATVHEVEPDVSTIRIRTSEKGIRPGDKAQVIYDVPTIARFDSNGRNVARVERAGTRRSNTNFFQLLLMGVLLYALLGEGRSRTNDVVAKSRAEATFSDFQVTPGVKVSWEVDAFVKGNDQRELFQIYRSDVINTPVQVVTGNRNTVTDTTDARSVTFSPAPGPRQFECAGALPAATAEGLPGVVAGRPYIYQVELVYSISGLDFPGGAAGRCFYISDRKTTGIATPLNRPELVSPQQNAVLDTADELNTPRFFFESVVDPTTPITVQYALQLSASPQFLKGQTETIGEFISPSTAQQTIAPGPFSSRITAIRNATTIYWRIGARNIDDKPGPVPDATGQRYIWSVPRSFTVVRDDLPPPPGG